MSECASIDGLVTPYVDGELAGADLEALEQHVSACPPCSARLATERAVRDLLRERHQGLRGACAPSSLRANCAALGRRVRVPSWAGEAPAASPRSLWGRRRAALAVAATLVLFWGGAALYEATRGASRLMADELTADHLKCFGMNAVLGTHQSATAVEAAMASDFGWNMRVPDGAERPAGLELVGARRCLYGGGVVAHLMFRDRGQPVSVFMLPHTDHVEQWVSTLGHQCAIWSGGDRTFVLVSREARVDADRLAAFARTAFR